MSPGRRARLALTAFAVIVSVAWLRVHFMPGSPPSTDLNRELQSIVEDSVQKDGSVKNCVLSVMAGDGSLVWSGAAGISRENAAVPMTSETPIYVASITKLFTATVVMLLTEKGALSLDDPMAKYLPSELINGINVCNGKDYSAEITVRQLLSHTTGIADYYSDRARDGKNILELFIESPNRSWTVNETIARARNDLKPKFPPGTGTSYSDTNYQLLGRMIEAVTGKPLNVLYEDFFFRPLGLGHTWLVGHGGSQASKCPCPADVFYGNRNITKIRSNGAYWADGGIVSTAEEMNLFLKALNEGRIIRPTSLQLMHQWRRLSFPLQYGYGTMRFNLPWPIRRILGIPPLWGHSGSTGSFLYYYQDLDLYMAGTIDQTESKIKPFMLMGRVIKAVRAKREGSKIKTSPARL
jgi:D-alanyl-D-alanine carboxypeptidase